MRGNIIEELYYGNMTRRIAAIALRALRRRRPTH